MIECQQFVWVHIPKTGGTWLREVLRSRQWVTLFGLLEHRDHWPLARGESRPALAFVRNPWDWWVSYFTFWRSHYERQTGGYSRPEPEWSKEEQWHAHWLRTGCLDFGECIRLAWSQGRSLTGYLERMGLHTAEYGLDHPGVTLGKFENLRQDVTDFLRRHIALPKDLEAMLTVRQAVNVTPHAPYQEYYDRSRENLIAQIEAEVIKRFGYQFGGS